MTLGFVELDGDGDGGVRDMHVSVKRVEEGLYVANHSCDRD